MSKHDRNACDRTLYVDDSGDSRALMIFAALDLENRFIPEAHIRWARFREEIACEGLIPAHVPLHAVKLIGGRGLHLHSYNEYGRSRERHRQYLRNVVWRGLQVVADMPGICIRVAYRRTLLHKTDRPELYLAMITELNRDLAESDQRAEVLIDGDGTDPSFRRAHHYLSAVNCRIEEKPLFLPAAQCGLLQAADLVAYTAHQSLAVNRNRSFMWDWFKQSFPQAQGPTAL
ncbi:DUF3800 domain-containing protein [Herbidospora yilanensis]|uniref:DUF3800 domain-containing protein n=1 Tax=Herbidospora yilanensis TaxID=354426 RepID=UPI0018DB1D75